MISNKWAFTLIELMIGVSVSIVLMVSVSVLATSGMKHITQQKRILDEKSTFHTFADQLFDTFSGDFDVRVLSSTSALVRHPRVAGRPHFTYLGTQSFTGYCATDPSKILDFLVLEDKEPFGLGKSGAFETRPLTHGVFQSGARIAGSETRANNWYEGIPALQASLLSPTGIVEVSGKLVMSETGNNRVVYLDGGKLFTLLDQSDGLLEPTGLKYDSTTSTLSIIDAKKRSIYQYSSSSSLPVSKALSFSGISLSNLDKIKITLVRDFNKHLYPLPFTGTASLTSFSTGTGDSVTFTSSGEWLYTFATPQSLNASQTYLINLSNLSYATGSLGAYFFQMTLYGTTQKQLYFPFARKGDGNIFSSNDNEYKIGTYPFPSKIPMAWSTTGSVIYEPSIQAPILDASLMPSNNPKYASTFPIKDFLISKSGGLVSVKLEYYEYYSCYDDQAHRVKTMLWKFFQD